MGRAPCCDKTNVKRGPWSLEEDALLKDYIQIHGLVSNWIALPPKAGLKRCGKSCRLRWLNYLRPDIKHGDFSNEEDRIILNLFTTIGSRWSVIAAQLPGRTDNDIKNYWNTKLKKKLILEMNADSQRTTHQQSDQFPVLEPTFNYYNNDNIPAHSFTSYYDQNKILSMNSSTLLNKGSSFNEYMVPMNQFQENFMRFGGEASSSSDDASSTDQTGYNKETEQDHFGSVSKKIENVDDLLQGYLCYGVDDHNYQKVEKSYGFYGENSLDISLEEIKQLISTNHCSSSNMLVDENKTAGKVTYY